jgi:hypothetical protein
MKTYMVFCKAEGFPCVRKRKGWVHSYKGHKFGLYDNDGDIEITDLKSGLGYGITYKSYEEAKAAFPEIAKKIENIWDKPRYKETVSEYEYCCKMIDEIHIKEKRRL